MKNFLIFAVVAFVLSSCAVASSPVIGVLYTDVKAPIVATANPAGKKVGTAEATSILGVVATGDASIDAAAKQAGISRISHVDYKVTSILGIFAKFTVFVYGE